MVKIIIIFTLILILVEGIPIFLNELNLFTRLLHKDSIKWRFKPFSCTICMSFWIGAILSICFLDSIYLSLYLISTIYEKTI